MNNKLTIHRFEVTPGPFKVLLPRHARILDVQMRGDNPQMWVLLDPDAPKVDRSFFVMGTGHVIEDVAYEQLHHCGTFQMNGGALVWHLFEALP